MRHLATIQKIEKLVPIVNADSIVTATMENLGWEVVVKKGEFQIGDKCVYLEIDSQMNPELNWVKTHAAFMEKNKYRLRTVKLRGQISQGLILPESILPELNTLSVGTDITELLGITKWEPIVFAGTESSAKGNFPSHLISKTDETRIQSILGILHELNGKEVTATVKLDGESATFINDGGIFRVCSRNLELIESPHNRFWNAFRLIEKGLARLPGFIIQGEVCGPGIAKNLLGLKSVQFFAFNMYNIEKKEYVNTLEMRKILSNLEIPCVPLNSVFTLNHTLPELLEMAKGKYEGTTNHREGIVIRPVIEAYSERLKGRSSFKVINNDYLLAKKE